MTEGDISQALRTAVEERRLESFPLQSITMLLTQMEAHSLKVGGEAVGWLAVG